MLIEFQERMTKIVSSGDFPAFEAALNSAEALECGFRGSPDRAEIVELLHDCVLATNPQMVQMCVRTMRVNPMTALIATGQRAAEMLTHTGTVNELQCLALLVDCPTFDPNFVYHSGRQSERGTAFGEHGTLLWEIVQEPSLVTLQVFLAYTRKPVSLTYQGYFADDGSYDPQRMSIWHLLTTLENIEPERVPMLQDIRRLLQDYRANPNGTKANIKALNLFASPTPAISSVTS